MNKLLILLKFFLFWSAANIVVGLIAFIILVKSNFSQERILFQGTKSVVVATGGSNRILKGINLVEDNIDRRMLITGVGKGISKNDIAKAIKANKKQSNILKCCVDLDLTAVNTQGNAMKASEWLKKNDSKNSFLVTANYHMPRLILEFKRVNPKINLNIIPVKPDLDPINKMYLPNNFILISKEYLKFLITKSNLKIILK